MAMSGPIVGKRRLRAELRRLRRERELTQDLVAAEMEWSLSKLIRIENGTVAISVSDLRSLLAYYRVHDPRTVDDLLALARAAKRRMWWDEFRPTLSGQLVNYVGFEAEAAQVGEWSPIMFPTLLQTRRYSDATGEPESARRVEFQARRQEELFAREEPPRLQLLLDETVLRRNPIPGDDALLVDQLEHTIEVAQRPYADVRVVPLSAGYHPGWEGEFAVLDFGIDDSVLYRGRLLWEEPELVAAGRNTLESLVGRALSQEATLDLLRQVVSELK
ncbi:helix-turn-helix transcriptional regulator [Dactylosporangium vinaceum]